MSNNEKYREAYGMLCEFSGSDVHNFVRLQDWTLSAPAVSTPARTAKLSKWLLDNKGLKVCHKDYIYLQDLQKAIDDQKTPVYNPVKNISRSKYERCTKNYRGVDLYQSSKAGGVWMYKSFCNKYYYWADYNAKNEVIYFRGEVDWVKSNYEPYEDEDTTTHGDGVLATFSVAEDAFDTGDLGREEEYVEVVECPEADELITPVTEWTDKHYDFNYTLTEDDIENGVIKIDPYFVADQWKLGEKDNSGVIFHILKTCSRYKCKHKEEREIKAIYGQIKRLAELRGIAL